MLHKSIIVANFRLVGLSEAPRSDCDDTYQDGDDCSGKGLEDVESRALSRFKCNYGFSCPTLTAILFKNL